VFADRETKKDVKSKGGMGANAGVGCSVPFFRRRSPPPPPPTPPPPQQQRQRLSHDYVSIWMFNARLLGNNFNHDRTGVVAQPVVA